MRIEDLGYKNMKKQRIAKEQCETLRTDRSGNASASLYGYDFKVSEPWFCGGDIRSNCNSDIFNGKDFSIMTNFSIEKLESILSDLLYLKELTEKRIADINKTAGIININVEKYKEGNKKLCRIFVTTHDLLTDGYGDREIVNNNIFEDFTISDTLKTQTEIEDKIKELEEKYGVKWQ